MPRACPRSQVRTLRSGPYMIPMHVMNRDIRRYMFGSFPLALGSFALVLGSACGLAVPCPADSARTGAGSKASEVYRSTPPAYRYEAAAMSLPQASKSLESIAACLSSLSSTHGHSQTPRPSHRLLSHPAIMPSPRHLGQFTLEVSEVGGRFPRDPERTKGHNLPRPPQLGQIIMPRPRQVSQQTNPVLPQSRQLGGCPWARHSLRIRLGILASPTTISASSRTYADPAGSLSSVAASANWPFTH